MTFRNLGQLKMERRFTDGTVIVAKSVFGHDFINIDVSKAVEEVPSCSITLVDLPETIQPMKYPSGIGQEEVEGTDYIKTYYTLEITNCSECKDIDFNVCDVDDLNYAGEGECNPFYFTDANVPSVEDDPNNHSIYSFSKCQAEIISFGEDGNGKYFLWKAYTEWPLVKDEYVDFSRSGLGYMILRAFIKNGVTELCHSGPFTIKVDCCWKNSTEREVVILAEKAIVNGWKEDCVERGDCETYDDCQEIWDWCPVPVELPVTALEEETVFRARPEELGHALEEGETKAPGDGSCIPYIWELISSESIGGIEPSGNFDESATYIPPDEGGCKDDITIIVKDRCETLYQTHRSACCDGAASLAIGYTSLVMLWANSQTLKATGGCSPYIWSLTGVGTLTPSEDGLTALYTAPSTGSCNNEPVITLTDCCGSNTNITIRFTTTDTYIKYRWVLDSVFRCPDPWDGPYYEYWWIIYSDRFSCETNELTFSEAVNNWTTSTNIAPTSTDEFCAEEGGGAPCGDCSFYIATTTQYHGAIVKSGDCCPT